MRMAHVGSGALCACANGRGWLTACLIVLPLVVLSPPAQAMQYGFECITGNLTGDCTIGESQLVMDVTDATDPNGAMVLFTFSNLGPESSTIRGIYFDDGTLLGISSIINDPNDVVFENDPNAGPADLPPTCRVGEGPVRPSW